MTSNNAVVSAYPAVRPDHFLNTEIVVCRKNSNQRQYMVLEVNEGDTK